MAPEAPVAKVMRALGQAGECGLSLQSMLQERLNPLLPAEKPCSV